MPPETLGIILLSGAYERAHYGLMLAVGAAAMGRRVVVFATNGGTRAVARDWSGLEGAAADAGVQAAGVAGLEELREAAGELGVVLMACDAGLRIAGVDAGALLPGVAVAGIPAFLSEVGLGQLTTV